ncbi:MAG TPA: hypothetical protein VIC35_12635 [Acidimicrobiia bacterium]
MSQDSAARARGTGRTVVVRFEPAVGGADRAAVPSVSGTVEAADVTRPPTRFAGWLELLGILEELSTVQGAQDEPATQDPTQRRRTGGPSC